MLKMAKKCPKWGPQKNTIFKLSQVYTPPWGREGSPNAFSLTSASPKGEENALQPMVRSLDGVYTWLNLETPPGGGGGGAFKHPIVGPDKKIFFDFFFGSPSREHILGPILGQNLGQNLYCLVALGDYRGHK